MRCVRHVRLCAEENARHFTSQGGLQTVLGLVGQPVQLSTHSLLQLVLALGHGLEHAGTCRLLQQLSAVAG